ncbi:unnamed protein product [Prunus brigantina]
MKSSKVTTFPLFISFHQNSRMHKGMQMGSFTCKINLRHDKNCCTLSSNLHNFKAGMQFESFTTRLIVTKSLLIDSPTPECLTFMATTMRLHMLTRVPKS